MTKRTIIIYILLFISSSCFSQDISTSVLKSDNYDDLYFRNKVLKIIRNLSIPIIDVHEEVFKKHNSKEADTGSAEGQIALFTARVAEITEHLKANKKDLASQRSLVLMVGKRRRLLKYLHTQQVVEVDLY